jgi:hypothetical protein
VGYLCGCWDVHPHQTNVKQIKHIQEMLVGLWSDGWAAAVGSGGEHDVQGSMYLK